MCMRQRENETETGCETACGMSVQIVLVKFTITLGSIAETLTQTTDYD